MVSEPNAAQDLPPAAAGGASPLATPWRPVTAATAALAGAWIAAGSVGLLAHPLRHALVVLALGVMVTSAWPAERREWGRIFILLAAAAVAVGMAASPLPVVNILAIALVLAAGAAVAEGPAGRLLVTVAVAVTVFAVYRFAAAAIPPVWSAADALGGAAGRLASGAAGRPLGVGATFGGVGRRACARGARTCRSARAAAGARGLCRGDSAWRCCGVVPAVAKSLARHSTIVLTMDHYTHTLIEDERAALGSPARDSPHRAASFRRLGVTKIPQMKVGTHKTNASISRMDCVN